MPYNWFESPDLTPTASAKSRAALNQYHRRKQKREPSRKDKVEYRETQYRRSAKKNDSQR